mgnify:CR=1 FL=1
MGINAMMMGPEVGVALPVHLVKSFLKEKLGTTPTLILPRKGGGDKSLPPSWGKARMGVITPHLNPPPQGGGGYLSKLVLGGGADQGQHLAYPGT